jgi:hypothetical protein
MKHLKMVIVILFTLLGTILLSACAKGEAGDLSLAPESQLREDIRQQPEVVKEAYRFALANPDLLGNIPCYCGCGAGHSGEAPHKSVKDCFVQEIKPDGTIVWDDMGMG